MGKKQPQLDTEMIVVLSTGHHNRNWVYTTMIGFVCPSNSGIHTDRGGMQSLDRVQMRRAGSVLLFSLLGNNQAEVVLHLFPCQIAFI